MTALSRRVAQVRDRFHAQRTRSILSGVVLTLGVGCTKPAPFVQAAPGVTVTNPAFRRCDSLPRETKYRPMPVTMLMPPMPIPDIMHGSTVTGAFEVDERGRLTELRITAATDREYGNRLARVWRSMKFRPAKTPDGTPVKGCFQLVMSF